MDKILLIFLAIMGWGQLGILIHYFSKKNLEYCSRYYSNIFSIFIIYYSFIFTYKYYYDSITETDIEMSNYANCIAASYAIFDLFRAVIKNEMEYILHHSIMFLAIFPLVLNDHNLVSLPTHYHIFLSMGLISETSTIFLNNCWLLYKENKADTLVFKINSTLTLITYTIFRVVNFTFLLYQMINYRYYYYLILHIPLTIQNYIWYYKLLNKYREMLYKKID